MGCEEGLNPGIVCGEGERELPQIVQKDVLQVLCTCHQPQSLYWTPEEVLFYVQYCMEHMLFSRLLDDL